MPRWGGAWLSFDGPRSGLPPRDIDARTVIGFACDASANEEMNFRRRDGRTLSRRILLWAPAGRMMAEKRTNLNWMDVLWLLFLLGLALIPPVKEFHKQALLLAFGVTQLFEGWV